MKVPAPQQIQQFTAIHSSGIVIAVATFAFDLLVPLGVAAAIPYALLVLLSLRSPGPGLTWFAAISGTVLTMAGYALSPEGGVLWIVLTNRFLALFVIWLTAYFCFDHKRHNRRMREAQRIAVKSERMASLGEMAAGVAHELGNPLAALQGRVELLEIQLKSNRADDQAIRGGMEIIYELSERMARIIRGMRTFARDASSDPLTPVSVSELIRDVLEFSKDRMLKLGIGVQVDGLDPKLRVPCREAQISQVLVNLLNNAADAIHELQERWIRIQVSASEDTVQISVADSGKGIPEELRSKVMKPFFTTKKADRGTGLGLSISQGIIEAHSGSLWIDENCPNTRFVMSLPRINP